MPIVKNMSGDKMKKPHISKEKFGAFKDSWKCTDGYNSGIADDPQGAYEAFRMAEAEHKAFYPYVSRVEVTIEDC